MLKEIVVEAFDAHDPYAANDNTDANVAVRPEDSFAAAGPGLLLAADSTPATLSAVALREISRMRSEGMLDDVRVLKTFAYHVTLAFCPPNLAYYITLDQDGAPWHASRCAQLHPAEQMFQQLAEQAMRLAATDIRRAEREARNNWLARHIEEAGAEVKALQEEIERRVSQEQGLVSRQNRLGQDIRQLDAVRTRAQSELSRLHQHVQQLENTLRRKEPKLRSPAQSR